jgi:transcriptional regulator with XRE-family HTH domain
MPGTLGKRVRTLRMERGLSQSSLARGLVSPSYVSLIEAGKRLPEREILHAFAERLGTTPEFLETGADAATAREELLWLRYAELALANGQIQESLEHFSRLADTGVLSRHAAEWGRARAMEAGGDLPGAIGRVEWLLDEQRAGHTHEPGLLNLLTTQCRLYREVGDLNHSIAVGERALAEVRQMGLTGTEEEIRLASTLVYSYWERGDWVRANLLATEVVERAEAHGSPKARGSAYWNASLAASSVGGLTLAIELAERAIASYSETDDERGLARLRKDMAWLLMCDLRPDLPRAHEMLIKARDTFVEIGMDTELAFCETELARYELAVGDPVRALEYADSAIARLADSDVLEQARVQVVRAYALAAAGDVAQARRACGSAMRVLRDQAGSRQQMGTWREAAELLVRVGDPDAAIEAYRALADCGGAPEPGWISATVTATAASRS